MSSSGLSEHDDASPFDIWGFRQELEREIGHLRDLDLNDSPPTLDTSELCTNIEEKILNYEDEPGLSDLRNKVLKLEICSDLTREVSKLRSHLAYREYTKSVDRILQIQKYNRIAKKISAANQTESEDDRYFIWEANNYLLPPLQEVPEVEAEAEVPVQAQDQAEVEAVADGPAQAQDQAEALPEQPEGLDEPPPKRRRIDRASVSEELEVARHGRRTAAQDSEDRPRTPASRPADAERIITGIEENINAGLDQREIRSPVSLESQDRALALILDQLMPAEFDSAIEPRRGSVIEPLPPPARYTGVVPPASGDRPEGDGQVPVGGEDILLPSVRTAAQQTFTAADLEDLQNVLGDGVSLFPEPDAALIDGTEPLHPGEEAPQEPEMLAQSSTPPRIRSPAQLEPPTAAVEAEEGLGRVISPRVPEALPRTPSPRQLRSPSPLLPDGRDIPLAEESALPRIPTLAQLAAAAVHIPEHQVQEIESEVLPEVVTMDMEEDLAIVRPASPRFPGPLSKTPSPREPGPPPRPLPGVDGRESPVEAPVTDDLALPRIPTLAHLATTAVHTPTGQVQEVVSEMFPENVAMEVEDDLAIVRSSAAVEIPVAGVQDTVLEDVEMQVEQDLAIARAVTPVQVTVEPPSEIAGPSGRRTPRPQRTPSPRYLRSPPLVPSRAPLPETDGQRATGEIIPVQIEPPIVGAAGAVRADDVQSGESEELPNVEVVEEQRPRRVRRVFDENTVIPNYVSRSLELNQRVIIERVRVYEGPPTLLQALDVPYLMRNIGFRRSFRERRIGDPIGELYTRHLFTSGQDYEVADRRVRTAPRSPREEITQRPQLEVTPRRDTVQLQVSGARPSVVETEMIVERTGFQRAEPEDSGLLRHVTPTVRRPTEPLDMTRLPREMPGIRRTPEPFIIDLAQGRVDEMQRADLVQQEVTGGAERPLPPAAGDFPRELPEIERGAVSIDIDLQQQAVPPMAEEMPRVQEVQREEPRTPITAQLQRLFGTPVTRLVQPELEPPDLRNVPAQPPRTPRTLRLQGMPAERREGPIWFTSTQRNAPEKRWKEFRYVQELLEEVWQEKEENNQPKSATIDEILRRADSYNRENALALLRIFDKLSLRNELILNFQNNNAIAFPFEPPYLTDVQMHYITGFENLDTSEE